MNLTQPLAGAHLRTYETIFQHPVSHNLAWRDVHILLGQLGHVAMESNGNLRVTRNGEMLVLHPHRTKEVAETSELMEIRHFIERSEKKIPTPREAESHWLVVINHHEARIFQSVVHGATPQQILPQQPEEYFRHAHDGRDFSSGKEKPAPGRFFEPVAQALKEAGAILLFGTGTGTSSEMDQFAVWLKKHHPELARRIKGTVVIDERHTTKSQLLAKAREFYASLPLDEKTKANSAASSRNSRLSTAKSNHETNQNMSTPITARDLTKQAPHSPRERLAGFVIAMRTIDKCRASIAGTLGEYHYDCPLDNVLFSFKGINGQQFKTAVEAAKNYEDVGAWLLANGTAKTPAEIKAWSDGVEASSMAKDPAKRANFAANCAKLGLDPDKSTTFDWLEADDRASFSKKTA